ncbi:hypothetical protein LTR17_027154 [Elasticomyces elasticus]|nr:hypothetical protein LTR17_027154 [Elasticomyces elasticus]
MDTQTLFNVRDMVFVVTGGGSGLGAMMSLALDANGASKVFVLGRREASLKDTASKAINASIIPVPCDVSSKEELQKAVDTIKKQTPFVNAVIANSGVMGPFTTIAPRPADETISSTQQQLWETSLGDSSQVFDVNVLGAFYTFVAFLNLLEAGNTHPESRGKTGFIQSQFITVSSLAAFSRSENVSYMYMASKAALVHLTKSLATGFGPRGIRANSISPGLYLTEMTNFVANGADLSIPGSVPRSQIPMTRTGAPADIAGAVLFLTSRAGAFLNGNVILSDGGAVGNEPATY